MHRPVISLTFKVPPENSPDVTDLAAEIIQVVELSVNEYLHHAISLCHIVVSIDLMDQFRVAVNRIMLLFLKFCTEAAVNKSVFNDCNLGISRTHRATRISVMPFRAYRGEDLRLQHANKWQQQRHNQHFPNNCVNSFHDLK